MRIRTYTLIALLACLLMAVPLLAQNPTGTIRGRVTATDAPMPGVTVTADSASMQGQKVSITGGAGEYIFRFLPPGDYKITFALDGYHTLEMPVVVSAAQSKTVDAEMYLDAVREEIVVTGNYDTVSVGTQSNVTMQQSLVEALPVSRTIESAVLLTPGTSSSGPNNAVTISGAMSYENLFLVNGVTINETIRGDPTDVYIEDAVEETTATASGVSAEYGRFSGGVVNVLTKSGGNQFSGSFRTSLTNDSWNGETPVTTDQEDKINTIYEATFGGYILRDRLWFFAAGRDRESDLSRQFYDGEPYTWSYEQQRLEGKLTWSPQANHRVIGSYVDVSATETNRYFTPWGPPMDSSSLYAPRELPQSLLALNYTGVLSESFFLEGQYSKRELAFVRSGGLGLNDRINGTMFYVSGYGQAGPMFCAECDDKTRDNEDYLVKASWFAGGSTGTHDIVFGVDSFNDQRVENNYQTPSNFRVFIYDGPAYAPDGTYYPVVGEYAEMDYYPMLALSQGTNFKTNSLFANDTWRLSPRWTLNLGLRYDKNDGKDSKGATVADDFRISPRLGASWDVMGDGNWVINASVGRYVTALANSIADSGGGGNASWIGYLYGGPMINTDGVNQCGEDHPEFCMYTSPEVLAIMFEWFEANGDIQNTDLWYAAPSIAGVNEIVEGLDSPYSDEYTIGFSKRLGTKGLLRLDYVHREFHDFYARQTDTTTGQVEWQGEVAPGVSVDTELDLSLIVNEDDQLKRKYDGLHAAIQYRFTDKLQLGGTYSLSRAQGTFVGETAGSGPVTSGVLDYPEYNTVTYLSDGDLPTDQRHKLRAWLSWDFLSTSRWNLNVSWLENFWTGTPYGSNGLTLVGGGYDWWFEDPGYLEPPLWDGIWLEPRDIYRTDDIHRTDLALNISFFIGKSLEIYLQPEVLNVFNESGVVSVNTSVRTWREDRSLNLFDPFDPTYTPEEGVDWYKVDEFGEPEAEGDFQTPRIIRFSVGIRF